jgi:ribonuclease-3
MKLLPGFLKANFSPDKKLFLALYNLLGFYPNNISIFKLAFTHRSVATEVKDGMKISNERLEYLGDAILSAIVADFLFKMFPLKDEGFLTEMRSKMVSRAQLNKLSQKLGLEQFIETHQETNGLNKSMMGDAFEAFIGAVYLDKGYENTRKILLNNIIANHYDMEELQRTELNYKSRLLEWSQKEKKNLEFKVISEEGASHKKQYLIEVLVDGESICTAVDFSIKGAEQLAAGKAFEIINPVS